MAEVAKQFVSAKVTLVIQQLNVLTPKEVTNVSALLITLEIHIERVAVILILVHWVIKTVDRMQHVCQMSVVRTCVKIHVTDSIVDLIHSVKLLITALDALARQVSVVILIPIVLASEFLYFVGTAKTAQIIKLVSMDSVGCSAAMITNVLLVKNVSIRNVYCLVSRIQVAHQEKLACLVAFAK